jgi:DNA-binding FadR family transcriptional regulator
LHGQLADTLGRRIVSGDLPPGSALPAEDTSMAEFKVSRTTYREAIKILTAKGLIDSRPRRGTRVRDRVEWSLLDPDLQDWIAAAGTDAASARAVLEMRQAFEPQIAAIAAERRSPADMERINRAFSGMSQRGIDLATGRRHDAEFHLAIAAATGNEMFIALMHALRAALRRGHGTRRPAGQDIDPACLARHDAVRRAIAFRDSKAAREAVERVLAGGTGVGQKTEADPVT